MIFSILYYPKTAFTATFRAVNNIFRPYLATLNCFSVGLIGYLSFLQPDLLLGSFMSTVCIGIGLLPFVVHSRIIYINLLGYQKTKTLPEERKREIERRFLLKPSAIDLSNAEVSKIREEVSSYIRDVYKVENPYFFRVTKQEKQFYVMGSNHSVSLNNLPPFFRNKILELLKNPGSLVVTESSFTLWDIISLLQHIKHFFSFASVLRGIVLPWYLSKDVDPETTYITMLSLAQFRKKSSARLMLSDSS